MTGIRPTTAHDTPKADENSNIVGNTLACSETTETDKKEVTPSVISEKNNTTEMKDHDI